MRVRHVRPDDRDFVLEVARRFADVELPQSLTAERVADGTRAFLGGVLDRLTTTDCFVVAESADGRPLGFLYAHERDDFFGGPAYGHVSEIAVAAHAEGTGAGGALMREAERWAAERGFERLTLNVFATNDRARRFYERLGYATETVTYAKSLS